MHQHLHTTLHTNVGCSWSKLGIPSTFPAKHSVGHQTKNHPNTCCFIQPAQLMCSHCVAAAMPLAHRSTRGEADAEEAMPQAQEAKQADFQQLWERMSKSPEISKRCDRPCHLNVTMFCLVYFWLQKETSAFLEKSSYWMQRMRLLKTRPLS